jgi:hypothetical protein
MALQPLQSLQDPSAIIQLVKRSPLLLAGGIPLTAALFVLATNGMVPFANDGHCDPWHYFGYFYVADRFDMLGASRTYSRLPETILGFVLTKLSPSVLADYANYIVLLVLTAGSVFLSANRLYGPFAASVAAIFLATSAIVIGVLSVTYTGPSLAWSTLAMVFAVRAGTARSDRRRSVHLLLAGFFWGAAIVGHLYSLVFNFVTPLYAIDWRRGGFRAILVQVLVIAAYWIAGTGMSLLVFGAIAKFLLHSEFTFFNYQFLEVFDIKVAAFQRTGWYAQGGKVSLVIIGLCLSVTQIFFGKWANPGDRSKALPANIPLLVLILVQLGYSALGGITLQYDYYYVWLMPPIALSLACLVASASNQLNKKSAVWYSAGFFILCLAATLPGYDTFVSVVPAWPSLVLATLVVGSMISLAVRPTASMLIASLVMLAAFGVTIRPERMGVQVWSQSGDGSAVYQRVRDGWKFISRLPFQERPLFWLVTKEPMSETIAYPRGVDYCHIDSALPGFLSPGGDYYDPKAENFEAGKPLVMAVPDEEVLAAASRTLKTDRNLQFVETARHRVSSGGVSYWLVAGKLAAVEGKE